MSQWTHIRGGLKLSSNPCEFKNKENPDYHFGSEDAYLPFPEEQIKIAMPYKDLDFNPYVYSLPRAKKYIEKAINFLPQGECGFSISINQFPNDVDRGSSSFDYPCEQAAFEKAILKLYNENLDICNKYENYDELKDTCENIDIGFVNYVNEIVLGVAENIRNCSGDEMLKGLEKFFNYLYKHDIRVIDGYLEWEDDWEGDYYYCWRASRLKNEHGVVYKFHKIDYKTNKILWTRTYSYPSKIEKKINPKNGKEYERTVYDYNGELSFKNQYF